MRRRFRQHSRSRWPNSLQTWYDPSDLTACHVATVGRRSVSSGALPEERMLELQTRVIGHVWCRRPKPAGFLLQTIPTSSRTLFATGSLPSSGSGADHEQEWLPCPLVYSSTYGSETMIRGGRRSCGL